MSPVAAGPTRGRCFNDPQSASILGTHVLWFRWLRQRSRATGVVTWESPSVHFSCTRSASSSQSIHCFFCQLDPLRPAVWCPHCFGMVPQLNEKTQIQRVSPVCSWMLPFTWRSVLQGAHKRSLEKLRLLPWCCWSQSGFRCTERRSRAGGWTPGRSVGGLWGRSVEPSREDGI